MSPAQFLGRMKKLDLAPAFLFLGSQGYDRRRCREALLDAHLTKEERVEGMTHYDLSKVSLAEVVDDARALSLFATKRLIIASSAEAAAPKTSRAAAVSEDDDEDDESAGGGAAWTDTSSLVEYMKSPTPGVVVLFEATRFALEGDDKKKAERVAKHFSAVKDVVELAAYNADDARREAQAIARQLKVSIDPAALELLVEALAADVARIATELEKLSLLSAGGRSITEEDIQAMVPDARSSTVFVLVNTLGRRDRARSLAVLDTLVREGVYLPLALSFLSSQFRQALIAQEANLRSSQQIQSHFQRLGVPMWGSRAEQVSQTANRFSRTQLERGLGLIFETDRDLRSARPDDRIIMENFVLRLTA